METLELKGVMDLHCNYWSQNVLLAWVMFIAITIGASSSIEAGEDSREASIQSQTASHKVSSLCTPPQSREAQVWATLDADTRRILVDRSSYVFKYGEVVIDAYFLLKWREELESLLSRYTVHSTRSNGSMRSKKVVGYEWKYLEKPEFETFFELPTFGVHFWFDGCLLNDKTMWDSEHYRSVRDEVGVAGYVSNADKAKAQDWVDAEVPLVLLVDPVAQRDPDVEAFSQTQSAVHLKRGVLADAFSEQVVLPVPHQGKLRVWPGKLRRSNFGSVQLPNLVGDEVRDGVPKLTADFFLLVPDPQSSSGPVLGPASRSQSGTVSTYRVERAGRYKLDAKELAILWVDGVLEIPYREVVRVDGDYLCTERLLQRP